MDMPWDVRVQPSHGVGAALLTCSVPTAVRPHVTVTRWLKDGTVMPPISTEAGESIILRHYFVNGDWPSANRYYFLWYVQFLLLQQRSETCWQRRDCIFLIVHEKLRKTNYENIFYVYTTCKLEMSTAKNLLCLSCTIEPGCEYVHNCLIFVQK